MFKTDEERRFVADHPGTPLGRGYPSGATLRMDGESHRQAWIRILRDDPCAYCGGSGGTIDHVVPQDPLVNCRGIGGKYSWTNMVGACNSCNVSKLNHSVLYYLLTRCGENVKRLYS